MENENYVNNAEMEENEELGTKSKTVLYSVLIAIVLVVAFFLNPSAADHQQKVNEMVSSFERLHSHKDRDFEIRAEAPEALRNLEYHSLGILSYTIVKDPKIGGYATIGVLGYVHPLFKLGF